MLNNVVGNKILAYKLIFVDWTRQTVDMKMKLLFFVKNGPSPASSSSFQINITILKQIHVKKCNVNGAEIWTYTLWNMSLLP